MPTQFTPSRRVRFKVPSLDGTPGWKGGVIVAIRQGECWCYPPYYGTPEVFASDQKFGVEYRVLCSLTGELWDVAASDCEDDGPRDDEGRRTNG